MKSGNWRSRSAPSLNTSFKVMGAILLTGAGIFHFPAGAIEWQIWWGYGLPVFVSGLLHIVYGVGLLTRLSVSRWYLVIGALVTVQDIGLYLITRSVGTPFFGPLAGEAQAVGLADIFAKVFQTQGVLCVMVLVVLSGYHRWDAWADIVEVIERRLLSRGQYMRETNLAKPHRASQNRA